MLASGDIPADMGFARVVSHQKMQEVTSSILVSPRDFFSTCTHALDAVGDNSYAGTPIVPGYPKKLTITAAGRRIHVAVPPPSVYPFKSTKTCTFSALIALAILNGLQPLTVG